MTKVSLKPGSSGGGIGNDDLNDWIASTSRAQTYSLVRNLIRNRVQVQWEDVGRLSTNNDSVSAQVAETFATQMLTCLHDSSSIFIINHHWNNYHII